MPYWRNLFLIHVNGTDGLQLAEEVGNLTGVVGYLKPEWVIHCFEFLGTRATFLGVLVNTHHNIRCEYHSFLVFGFGVLMINHNNGQKVR